MAAVITYAAPRITITGPYKQLTGSSTSTVVTFAAGEAPAAGDVGRSILYCRGGTADTSQWQTRRIVAATSTTATTHDAWIGTPSPGDTFRISTKADDILAAQPTAGTKLGSSTFFFPADIALAAGAFFASADESLEFQRSAVSPLFPLADGCVFQIGTLWGGEANGSTETTNGSRFALDITSALQCSIFTTDNVRKAAGPVVNYYGAMLKSKIVGTPDGGNFLYQRMCGPSRMIGCISDGQMGGRFYHEVFEWVDNRMSGNDNTVPAWSIAVTPTRNIENVFFFRNLMAFKNYNDNDGIFRGCKFSASNTYIASIGTTIPGSVLDLIDCTEFDDSKTFDSGAYGTLRQYRGINLTTTDNSGTALTGVKVRVANSAGTEQGAATSGGGGTVSEILALRRIWVDAAPSTAYTSFVMRLRKYGKVPIELPAPFSDPVKQAIALYPDASTTSDKATVDAMSGFTFNGGTKTLALSVIRTAQEIYNRCTSWLEDNMSAAWFPSFDVGVLNLGDWALEITSEAVVIPAGMSFASGTKLRITGGTSGGIVEGRGRTFTSGSIFENTSGTPKVLRLTATQTIPTLLETSGTIAVDKSVPITVTGPRSGSKVRIIRTDTNAELAIGTADGSGFTAYVDWSTDIPIQANAAYAVGLDAEQEAFAIGTLTSTGASLILSQSPCTIYEGNNVDGDDVELTLDAPNVQANADELDNEIAVQEIYAWYKTELMTDAGIRTLFKAVTPINSRKYVVNTALVNFHIHNLDTSHTLMITGGVIQRDDGTSIRAGGDPAVYGSIEMVPSDVYESASMAAEITAINSRLPAIPASQGDVAAIPAAPAAATVASAVRTEIATELARIDVVASTRPTLAQIEVSTILAKEATVADVPEAVLSAVYEGTETVQDYLRLTRAPLLGKTSGGGTTSETFYGADGIKPRVVSANDGVNRTAVTTDPS